MPYASGNALGYVRMVRSASMYYCSEAVKYLPDFDDIINFEDCAGLGMRSEQDADGGGRAVYVGVVGVCGVLVKGRKRPSVPAGDSQRASV
jgi:hypothetical protein